MHKHHEESINNLIEYFKANREVIAIVLGGSLARGTERADSDVDALVIVTDGYYKKLCAENRQAEVIHGHCTYENGIFDIKYLTKDFLEAAALRGSEPTRNSFIKARCLYTKDSDIENIVPKIGVFQVHEVNEKMFSFYSGISLHYGYFWKISANNLHLRVRSASEIVLFGYRMLLQENHVLFPSQRRLTETTASLARKPEHIIEKGELLLKTLTNEAADDFVNSILGFIKYKPPENKEEIGTRFIDDNEFWWYKNRPIVTEW